MNQSRDECISGRYSNIRNNVRYFSVWNITCINATAGKVYMSCHSLKSISILQFLSKRIGKKQHRKIKMFKIDVFYFQSHKSYTD